MKEILDDPWAKSTSHMSDGMSQAAQAFEITGTNEHPNWIHVKRLGPQKIPVIDHCGLPYLVYVCQSAGRLDMLGSQGAEFSAGTTSRLVFYLSLCPPIRGTGFPYHLCAKNVFIY